MKTFIAWMVCGAVFGSLVVLTGCETTNPAETQLALGTTVSNPFVVGGKQISLPPGKWVVRARTMRTTNAGTPIIRAILVDADRNVPRITLYLATNLQPAANFEGWSVYRYCSRDDMHHRETKISIPGGDQECWWVNHFRHGRTTRTRQVLLQLYDFVKSRGRTVPANTVSVGFRFANRYDFLTLQYHFNPEAEGFPPPKRAAWTTSDWHVDKVAVDAKKVVFIDRLKRWGVDWLPKVRAGFEGKLKRVTDR